ncbi:MAG: DegT/DnrJ/EryC1/StrS family aminotransferase [Bacteroidota bacterium]
MIPVNEPLLDHQEMRNVVECLQTGWISSEGKFISEFESKWATYCGMKYGIAISNGTTALEAAVWSLNLKPGSEIIIPTFTIISCAMAVIRNGHTPVLVDAEPRTWNMDVKKIEEKITPNTKAIMVVHIYGHPTDMDPVLELARKYNLYIIEDAAEVHGAEYKGKKCGSFGDVSTFSFYANKLITTGEGGMVLTNNEQLAERVRSFRNLCFKKERRFYHTELGNNYRLTNLQAAIGSAQVDRINDIVMRKRKMGALYNQLLAECPHVQLPVEEQWAKHVYWMYGIVLDEKSGMDAFQCAQRLLAEGVQTRPFFLGMHEQPVLQNMGLFKNEHYPVAERIARQGFYLPSGLALNEKQMIEVATALKKVLR